MNRSAEVQIKVGIFVALGTGLLMVAILLLSGRTFMQSNNRYHTKFSHVDGLVEGANVKIAGITVGQVDRIELVESTGEVDVYFSVGSKYVPDVRTDSWVGTATQGMLGDRYLVVSSGSSSAQPAPNGAELKSEAPKDIKDYLSGADQVLDSLKSSMTHLDSILGSFQRNSRAENLFHNMSQVSSNLNAATQPMPTKMKEAYEAIGHMKSILAKIDNGEGTLGALVNDPSLYDDLKNLVGGANRNRVVRYFIHKSVEDSREAEKKKP